MFSLRIVSTSHYQADPLPDLDVQHSSFRSTDVRKVPILRIFGATPAGQKTCMHVHGVFPYLSVLYDGTQPIDSYLRRFAASLDKAINVANNSNANTQHVFKISLVSGIPMYGYHDNEQQFLKIYLYNPKSVRKAADLLLGGAVMNKPFQPHEAHIPFPLQLFIDYNLYGMNLINVAAVKFRRTRKGDGDEENDNSIPGSSLEGLGDVTGSSTSFLHTPSSSNTPCVTRWDPHDIPNKMLLPDSVERQSMCELEVDVVAADILNRREVTDNMGSNPGLAALWEDERQRRRDTDQSSQITPQESQEHQNVEAAPSELHLLERLTDILEQQCVLSRSESEESSVSMEDTTLVPEDASSIPASHLEDHSQHRDDWQDSVPSSQDTVIVTEEDDESPIISLESIQRVVSFSQSFACPDSQPNSTPQDGGAGDQSLVDILAALAEENSPSASQRSAVHVSVLEDKDSVVGQGVPLPPDDAALQEDEEETLHMSQALPPEPRDKVNQFDLEGLDASWHDSSGEEKDEDYAMDSDDREEEDDSDDNDIPQLDGTSDKKNGSKKTSKKQTDSRGPGTTSGSDGTASEGSMSQGEPSNPPTSPQVVRSPTATPGGVGPQSIGDHGVTSPHSQQPGSSVEQQQQSGYYGPQQWGNGGGSGMSQYPVHMQSGPGWGQSPPPHGSYPNMYRPSGYGYYPYPHLQRYPYNPSFRQGGPQSSPRSANFSPPPPRSPMSPQSSYSGGGAFSRASSGTSPQQQQYGSFGQTQGLAAMRRHSEGSVGHQGMQQQYPAWQYPGHPYNASGSTHGMPVSGSPHGIPPGRMSHTVSPEMWSSPFPGGATPMQQQNSTQSPIGMGQFNNYASIPQAGPSSQQDHSQAASASGYAQTTCSQTDVAVNVEPSNPQPSTLQALLEAPESSRVTQSTKRSMSMDCSPSDVLSTPASARLAHGPGGPEFKYPEKRSGSFSSPGSVSMGQTSALSSLYNFVSNVDPMARTPTPTSHNSTPTPSTAPSTPTSGPSPSFGMKEEEGTSFVDPLSGQPKRQLQQQQQQSHQLLPQQTQQLQPQQPQHLQMQQPRQQYETLQMQQPSPLPPVSSAPSEAATSSGGEPVPSSESAFSSSRDKAVGAVEPGVSNVKQEAVNSSSDSASTSINSTSTVGGRSDRLGKQGRMRKLGLNMLRTRQVSEDSSAAASPPASSSNTSFNASASYTFTFHVPTPVYKRFKVRGLWSPAETEDIRVVRMHPMDARRYSLLKIGRELVRVHRLSAQELRGAGVPYPQMMEREKSGSKSPAEDHHSLIDPHTGELLSSSLPAVPADSTSIQGRTSPANSRRLMGPKCRRSQNTAEGSCQTRPDSMPEELKMETGCQMGTEAASGLSQPGLHSGACSNNNNMPMNSPQPLNNAGQIISSGQPQHPMKSVQQQPMNSMQHVMDQAGSSGNVGSSWQTMDRDRRPSVKVEYPAQRPLSSGHWPGGQPPEDSWSQQGSSLNSAMEQQWGEQWPGSNYQPRWIPNAGGNQSFNYPAMMESGGTKQQQPQGPNQYPYNTWSGSSSTALSAPSPSSSTAMAQPMPVVSSSPSASQSGMGSPSFPQPYPPNYPGYNAQYSQQTSFSPSGHHSSPGYPGGMSPGRFPFPGASPQHGYPTPGCSPGHSAFPPNHPASGYPGGGKDRYPSGHQGGFMPQQQPEGMQGQYQQQQGQFSTAPGYQRNGGFSPHFSPSSGNPGQFPATSAASGSQRTMQQFSPTSQQDFFSSPSSSSQQQGQFSAQPGQFPSPATVHPGPYSASSGQPGQFSSSSTHHPGQFPPQPGQQQTLMSSQVDYQGPYPAGQFFPPGNHQGQVPGGPQNSFLQYPSTEQQYPNPPGSQFNPDGGGDGSGGGGGGGGGGDGDGAQVDNTSQSSGNGHFLDSTNQGNHFLQQGACQTSTTRASDPAPPPSGHSGRNMQPDRPDTTTSTPSQIKEIKGKDTSEKASKAKNSVKSENHEDSDDFSSKSYNSKTPRRGSRSSDSSVGKKQNCSRKSSDVSQSVRRSSVQLWSDGDSDSEEDDSIESDESSDSYQPASSMRWKGQKRNRSRQGEGQTKRTKQSSVNCRVRAHSKYSDNESERKPSRARSRRSKNHKNKKFSQPEPLIEGVHYIVVGKFKGHKVMLVKMERVKVKIDERVIFSEWQKNNSKQDQVNTCKTRGRLLGPRCHRLALGNSASDPCFVQTSEGKNDHHQDDSDASTIVEGDLDFKEEHPPPCCSGHKVESGAEECSKERTGMDESKKGDSLKGGDLSHDCASVNKNTVGRGENKIMQQGMKSQGPTELTPSDKSSESNKEGAKEASSDSKLRLKKQVETGDKEKKVDKRECAIDRKTIENPVVYLTDVGLETKNNENKISCLNKLAEKQENKMNTKTPNPPPPSVPIPSPASGDRASDQGSTDLPSDSKEEDVDYKMAALEAPPRTQSPIPKPGKRPNDSPCIVSEHSQDADCSSLPHSNLESASSSSSPVSPCIDFSAASSECKDSKLHYQLKPDDDVAKLVEKEQGERENNCSSSRPGSFCLQSVRERGKKKVRSKQQPSLEASSDSSDSHACFSEVRVQRDHSPQSVHFPWKENLVSATVTTSSSSTTNAKPAEVDKDKLKKSKTLTTNQRLGVAFLSKRRRKNKGKGTSSKGEGGSSGSNKVLDSLSLLHMATLASYGGEHSNSNYDDRPSSAKDEAEEKENHNSTGDTMECSVEENCEWKGFTFSSDSAWKRGVDTHTDADCELFKKVCNPDRNCVFEDGEASSSGMYREERKFISGTSEIPAEDTQFSESLTFTTVSSDQQASTEADYDKGSEDSICATDKPEDDNFITVKAPKRNANRVASGYKRKRARKAGGGRKQTSSIPVKLLDSLDMLHTATLVSLGNDPPKSEHSDLFLPRYGDSVSDHADLYEESLIKMSYSSPVHSDLGDLSPPVPLSPEQLSYQCKASQQQRRRPVPCRTKLDENRGTRTVRMAQIRAEHAAKLSARVPQPMPLSPSKLVFRSNSESGEVSVVGDTPPSKKASLLKLLTPSEASISGHSREMAQQSTTTVAKGRSLSLPVSRSPRSFTHPTIPDPDKLPTPAIPWNRPLHVITDSMEAGTWKDKAIPDALKKYHPNRNDQLEEEISPVSERLPAGLVENTPPILQIAQKDVLSLHPKTAPIDPHTHSHRLGEKGSLSTSPFGNASYRKDSCIMETTAQHFGESQRARDRLEEKSPSTALDSLGAVRIRTEDLRPPVSRDTHVGEAERIPLHTGTPLRELYQDLGGKMSPFSCISNREMYSLNNKTSPYLHLPHKDTHTSNASPSVCIVNHKTPPYMNLKDMYNAGEKMPLSCLSNKDKNMCGIGGSEKTFPPSSAVHRDPLRYSNKTPPCSTPHGRWQCDSSSLGSNIQTPSYSATIIQSPSPKSKNQRSSRESGLSRTELIISQMFNLESSSTSGKSPPTSAPIKSPASTGRHRSGDSVDGDKNRSQPFIRQDSSHQKESPQYRYNKSPGKSSSIFFPDQHNPSQRSPTAAHSDQYYNTNNNLPAASGRYGIECAKSPATHADKCKDSKLHFVYPDRCQSMNEKSPCYKSKSPSAYYRYQNVPKSPGAYSAGGYSNKSPAYYQDHQATQHTKSPSSHSNHSFNGSLKSPSSFLPEKHGFSPQSVHSHVSEKSPSAGRIVPEKNAVSSKSPVASSTGSVFNGSSKSPASGKWPDHLSDKDCESVRHARTDSWLQQNRKRSIGDYLEEVIESTYADLIANSSSRLQPDSSVHTGKSADSVHVQQLSSDKTSSTAFQRQSSNLLVSASGEMSKALDLSSSCSNKPTALEIGSQYLSGSAQQLPSNRHHLSPNGHHLSSSRHHLSSSGHHLSSSAHHLSYSGQHLSSSGQRPSSRGQHLSSSEQLSSDEQYLSSAGRQHLPFSVRHSSSNEQAMPYSSGHYLLTSSQQLSSTGPHPSFIRQLSSSQAPAVSVMSSTCNTLVTASSHPTWTSIKTDNFENITDDEDEDIVPSSQEYSTNAYRYPGFRRLSSISSSWTPYSLSSQASYPSATPNASTMGSSSSANDQECRNSVASSSVSASSGVYMYNKEKYSESATASVVGITNCSSNTTNSFVSSIVAVTSKQPATQPATQSLVTSPGTPWRETQQELNSAPTTVSSVPRFEPITDSEEEDENGTGDNVSRAPLSRYSSAYCSSASYSTGYFPAYSTSRMSSSYPLLRSSSGDFPSTRTHYPISGTMASDAVYCGSGSASRAMPLGTDFPSSRAMPSDASYCASGDMSSGTDYLKYSDSGRWPYSSSSVIRNQQKGYTYMTSAHSMPHDKTPLGTSISSQSSVNVHSTHDIRMPPSSSTTDGQVSGESQFDINGTNMFVCGGGGGDDYYNDGDPQDAGGRKRRKAAGSSDHSSSSSSGQGGSDAGQGQRPAASGSSESDERGRRYSGPADGEEGRLGPVLCPKALPPSRRMVEDSAVSVGLSVEPVTRAFCSHPNDLPDRPRELGGRVLRLATNRMTELEDFPPPGEVRGLRAWQSLKAANSCLLSSQPDPTTLAQQLEKEPQLRYILSGDRPCVITPVKPPPRCSAVTAWLQDKLRSLSLSARREERLRGEAASEETSFPLDIDAPVEEEVQGGDDNSSDDEEDSMFTRLRDKRREAGNDERSRKNRLEGVDDSVDKGSTPKKQRLDSDIQHSTPVCTVNPDLFTSPCTPIHSSSQTAGPSGSAKKGSEPSAGGEFITPKRPPMRRLSTNTESALRHAIFTPQSRKQSLEGDVSQIDGPTPKNTHGFKVTQQNLQDAKALHKHQYLTVLSMELHIDCRGDLQPDPEVDSIRVIFYAVFNDVPPDQGRRNVTGAIVVDKESYNLTARNEARRSPSPSPRPSTSKACTPPSRGKAGSSRTLFEKCGVLEDLDVVYVKSEGDLLQEFTQLLARLDPDILLGFEIQQLSWGFLLHRAAHLNFNLSSQIARIQGSKGRFQAAQDEWGADNSSEIHVEGRIVLNLWRVLRHEVTLNIYNYENCAFHILHRRVPAYTFHTLTNWYNHRTHLHRWRVIQYYTERVTGQLAMLDQLDIIGKTSEFARVFGIEFYDVLSRGSQYRVESMMLRLAKPLNFIPVSPSVQQRARQKAAEVIPLTLEPESSFYTDPLVVLDFQSLYPSIMIAYNYCFSTCLGRLDNLANAKDGPIEFGCTSLNIPPRTLRKLRKKVTVSPNGCVFVSSKVRRGILPIMVEEILKTRLMVKKSMKDYKDDKMLYRMLDARQLGLKLIANVTYGYTGASFSGRMPCVEVADSIVRKARESLERAIQLVEDTPHWQARVVYGDTDSLFILLPGRSKQQAFVVGQEIADAVTNMFPKPMKLKFEKVYLPCALQTKKRYVGFMYETNDQKDPVFDAKGIETVRRDNCGVVSKLLERCIKILFTSRDLSLVRSYLQRQLAKMLSGHVGLHDYVFAKEYRGMMGYKPGACVPALEIAKKRLASDRRAEPRVGERVPYVIVYGTPGLPLIQLVRQPHELLRDPSLRINVTYYITKQVLPPLDRLLGLVGVNVVQWYNDTPKVVRLAPHVAPSAETKQGTISQYFATSDCLVCEQQTKQAVCTSCLKDPQLVAITLASHSASWESVHDRLSQVCMTCMGIQDHAQPCNSLDCPVLFRRHLATCNLARADQQREALLKMLTF